VALPKHHSILQKWPVTSCNDSLPSCKRFLKQRPTFTSGVTNLFGTESYLEQNHAKGYQFDTHASEIKFAKFIFNYVIINKN